MSADGVDDRTVSAQQVELAERGRARRFLELLHEHDAQSRPRGRELSGEALLSVAEFERHVARLTELVQAELEVLAPVRGPLYDITFS